MINSDQKLLIEIISIIEIGRQEIVLHANQRTLYMFWQIGKRINEVILSNKLADYGKKIVALLATQMMEHVCVDKHK